MDTFGGSEAASAGREGGGATGFAATLSDRTQALEALFEEAAFGVDFFGAPADEVGDAFFVLGEGALVADGFRLESEFFAFEEAGDEFSDEFGWRRAARENVVDFDKVADGVNFFKEGGNDFVGNYTFGVDGAYSVDVDFLQKFVLSVEVGEPGYTTKG